MQPFKGFILFCLFLQVRYHGGPALPQPLRPRAARAHALHGPTSRQLSGRRQRSRSRQRCRSRCRSRLSRGSGKRSSYPCRACGCAGRHAAGAAAGAAPSPCRAAAACWHSSKAGGWPRVLFQPVHEGGKPGGCSCYVCWVQLPSGPDPERLATGPWSVQVSWEHVALRKCLCRRAIPPFSPFYLACVQCIGRVIRHRGDWASVLLVDARCGGCCRWWWCSAAAAAGACEGVPLIPALLPDLQLSSPSVCLAGTQLRWTRKGSSLARWPSCPDGSNSRCRWDMAGLHQAFRRALHRCCCLRNRGGQAVVGSSGGGIGHAASSNAIKEGNSSDKL